MPLTHTAEDLAAMQQLCLDAKIDMTKRRVMDWYNHWGYVYLSWSGGKDSTVLKHIVDGMYDDDIPAVHCNTGLEYPEIERFVLDAKEGRNPQLGNNVEILRPKMVFNEVIGKYGYPLIGKEVAEAIYYARRIRSQNVNVEREREPRNENAQNYKETVRRRGEPNEKTSRDEFKNWRRGCL